MSIRTALAALATLCAGAALAQAFAPAEIAAWSAHRFKGETTYALTEIDGAPAVRARCENSASGLALEREIDLTRTPILEWRWRVDAVFPPGPPETERAGDDYPARLYVIRDGGLLPWRTRALNYVWASAAPRGANWPNAYAAQARMIALRTGADAGGGWVVERRDLRADFRRFHDLDATRIDAVAIMTDCDDRGGRAEAWYGAIRFLAE